MEDLAVKKETATKPPSRWRNVYLVDVPYGWSLVLGPPEFPNILEIYSGDQQQVPAQITHPSYDTAETKAQYYLGSLSTRCNCPACRAQARPIHWLDAIPEPE